MDLSLIKGWIEPGSWIDFFLPPLCSGCGEYTEEKSLVCGECRRKIQEFCDPSCLRCGRQSVAGTECEECRKNSLLLFAYGEYSDPLREIILQFKFKGVTGPAEFVAERLVAQFAERLALYEGAVLVPIPLHSSREHTRGYSQAELFAETLADRLGLELDCDLLYRIVKRKPQSKLRVEDRGANISGVFDVAGEPEHGSSVILVDDVVTTGHTVGEARRELERRGFHVRAVIAMALAR